MTAYNFFTQWVEIFEINGHNKAGQQIYSTSRKVKGKFVNRMSRFRNADGEEIIADSTLFVPLDDPSKMKQRVVYNSREYEIIYIGEQVGTVTSLKHKKLGLKLSSV